MSSIPEALSSCVGDTKTPPKFGGYSNIVDYILGITFQIWEQRQVDSIVDYYSSDIEVYSLDGITHGAAGMVEQTHATLKAFPDRLLLADDVIWSGNLARGFSSHRIISPMTNTGDGAFGSATGRHVLAMNIADCEITDGRITREWLLRDNLALTRQLGFDSLVVSRELAERMDAPLRNWLAREFERVRSETEQPPATIGQQATDTFEPFARKVLQACWISGEQEVLDSVYAPYCVLHRAPIRVVSGQEAVLEHYAAWRDAVPNAKLSLDHICSQPFNRSGRHVAVRWSIAGLHEGSLCGLDASGKPVYAVGVTHWRILDDRIIAEWTVFDEIALMAQVLSSHS